MAKKEHVSETQATQLLKANKVAFTEHPYEYLEHGGAMHSAQVLGLDPFTVVKTLVMQDQDARPLLVIWWGEPPLLAHGGACLCTLRKPFSDCPALPSTAGDAGFWCNWTRRSACSCWRPRLCVARWQNSWLPARIRGPS